MSVDKLFHLATNYYAYMQECENDRECVMSMVLSRDEYNTIHGVKHEHVYWSFNHGFKYDDIIGKFK